MSNFVSYENADSLVRKIDASKEKLIFKGTSAEWDALTVDEQAKYSIRFFTDKTTTESDVVDEVTDGETRAVSSGAVHDAVYGIKSGTGTRNTSYVSSASFAAEWYKVGRICTVNLQFNLSAATTSNEELITGLPKPITEIACVGEGSSNTTVSDFVIKKNGAVRTHYTAPEGQFMHGTATYITAEE